MSADRHQPKTDGSGRRYVITPLELFARIAVFLVLGVLAAIFSNAWAADRITPQEAFERMQKGVIVLVDIRRPSEWAESGIPEGALPLSMHGAGGARSFVTSLQDQVDTAKPIALICAGGMRSRYFQWRLGLFGLSNVLDVSEGVFGNGDADGWVGRGLPMTPYTEDRSPRAFQYDFETL